MYRLQQFGYDAADLSSSEKRPRRYKESVVFTVTILDPKKKVSNTKTVVIRGELFLSLDSDKGTEVATVMKPSHRLESLNKLWTHH
jgi:hypothetical protein